MWNLRQIRDLAIANVARFASLNACFSFLSKKFQHVVIYMSLWRDIYPSDLFWKSLRSDPKHMALLFDDFSFLSKKYHYVVVCHSHGTMYNPPTYFEKKWKLEERIYMVLVFDVPPLNYCFEADVMDFFSGRSLVERFNSADQINLLVACTADCTCHHASD